MKHLKDLWDEGEAGKWSDDPLELLRYRSNLLGADLRITNFGGGNTSSKFELSDPFAGQPVRVNGIAPATVIEGSSMFPRARLVESLKKYDVAFESTESTESLREKLAQFYSRRTLTGRLAGPEDCAEAVCWLAGDRAAAITGHIIPVDGGLIEAFFR